jgi:hypothetical protein
MSLGHSTLSSALDAIGRPARSWVPWQYGARPRLVLITGSVISILLAIGLLVVARRLTGSFSAELPPTAMLLMALAAVALLAFTRIAWRRSFPLETPADLSGIDQIIGWASSAALAALAIGCCYPANRTADWLIWLPILTADQFWRQNFFDVGEPWRSTREDPGSDHEAQRVSPTRAPTNPGQHDDIVQQLYRLRDEQDRELIYGTVRADFAAGQRTAVVHVGFCPPLAYLPEIEAGTLPRSAANIKIVQALSHGTRLDVRLPAAAAADCQVWIDLAARPVESNR